MAQTPDKDKRSDSSDINNNALEADLESVERALIGLQGELKSQETNAEKLKQAQEDILETQKKQEVSIALRKRLLKIAISAAIIAVIAAFAAGFGTWKVYQQQKQNENERIARTIASCKQYNEQVKRTVDGDVAQAVGLIDISDLVAKAEGRQPTPLQTKALFINHEKQVSQAVNPYRDCSTEGINAYLSKTNLIIECTPDGEGFCKPMSSTVPPTTVPSASTTSNTTAKK